MPYETMRNNLFWRGKSIFYDMEKALSPRRKHRSVPRNTPYGDSKGAFPHSRMVCSTCRNGVFCGMGA